MSAPERLLFDALLVMPDSQRIKSGEVVAAAIIGREVLAERLTFGSLERLADNEVQLILGAAPMGSIKIGDVDSGPVTTGTSLKVSDHM